MALTCGDTLRLDAYAHIMAAMRLRYASRHTSGMHLTAWVSACGFLCT
jgi:hypothetical protein